MLFRSVLVSKESRTRSIIFYALCLLYVLSTATVVSDLLAAIIQVSNDSICKIIIFLSVMQMSTLPVQLQQSMLFSITIVQTTSNGCCDFIAQCTLVRINRLYLSSILTLKFSQRSTVVGSCGVKISAS